MVDKTEKPKQIEQPKKAEQPKKVEKAKQPEKVKQPNRIVRWWRETVGELRKVTWPTTDAAWRLTKIVLAVMFFMSIVLGLLDFVFSSILRLIVG